MRNLLNAFDKLACPNCQAVGMRLITDAGRGDEPVPASGYAVCEHCAMRYPIAEHILDLAPHRAYPLTLAGRSNLSPFAPTLYENVWRPRSLSLLSGEAFPPARELALLNEWAHVAPDELVLDVGTSTGFYARGLARTCATAQIVALDQARGMLRTARTLARREGFKNLIYLRAFAQALPFADAGVDVIVCGGSLNEFDSMTDALRELRRVLKTDGRLVVMSLLAASSPQGKLAQQFFGISGIRFPTRAGFNTLAQEAGLRVVAQQAYGCVLFSRLVKCTE